MLRAVVSLSLAPETKPLEYAQLRARVLEPDLGEDDFRAVLDELVLEGLVSVNRELDEWELTKRGQ